MRSTIQRCAMRCCMSSLIRLTPLTSRNVTTSPKARCLAPARSVRSARPRRTARSMVTRRPPSAQRGAGHLAQVGHAARVGRGLSWGAPRGRRPSLGPAPSPTQIPGRRPSPLWTRLHQQSRRDRTSPSYDPNTVNRQRPTSRKSLVYLRYQIRTCVPGDHHETDVLMHSLISADTAARAARTSVLPA